MRKDLERSSSGISLIEVLIVIGIIGILLGLTGTAVQSARESARRMHCQGNLRQIGLAMLLYHDVHGYYPTNWFDQVYDGKSRSKSWLSFILPYVEQQPVYDLIDMEGRNDSPTNLVAQAITIPTYLCPSDPDSLEATAATYGPAANTNYKGCAGWNWNPNWSTSGNPPNGWGGPSLVGRFAGSEAGGMETNGLIGSGYFDYESDPPGPVMEKNLVKIADIIDGTSNTFAAGEAVKGWAVGGQWYSSWVTHATCAMPLNYLLPGKTHEDMAGDWPNSWGFHSRHSNGVNFVMCDGSVHFIHETIELKTVQYPLAQYDDRQSVTVP